MASDRILVVDGDKERRDEMAQVLAAEGYEVVIAEHPAGIRKTSAEAAPDIVLLDVSLLGKHGPELARVLRQCCPDTSLIAIAEQQTGAAALPELDADDYVNTPLQMGKLIVSIQMALWKRRGRPEREDSGEQLGTSDEELRIQQAIAAAPDDSPAEQLTLQQSVNAHHQMIVGALREQSKVAQAEDRHTREPSRDGEVADANDRSETGGGIYDAFRSAFQERQDSETTKQEGLARTPQLHGQIGEMSSRFKVIDRFPVFPVDAKSHIAEEFRILAVALQALDSPDGVTSVMITSTHHREGKSLVTLGLACAMANDRDKSVLVVEADLYRPGIAKTLQMEFTSDISAVLNDEVPLEEAIVYSRGENLAVLGARKPTTDASSLLQGPRMRRLIEEVRSSFDFVLFDAPPALSTVGARVVGAQIDGAVLVVQAYKTQREAVDLARSSLEQSGVKVLGVILNQKRFYIPKYLYRYQYHYSHYYDTGDKKAP